MRWKMPPHGGIYKLVVTRKSTDDIRLIVLCPGPREYNWSAVPHLIDEELKAYLLSMEEEIEAGVFDLELLEKELEE